jgi:hypothetical protein
MPRRIPEPQRWAVIEKWMLGLPRNTISGECGLSNGAVTSIVDDWRRSTGLELSILIRDIGVTLRKLGMSPATGLRVSKLIERIGLYDDNSIESFLSEVYTRCQELGVNPNHIANLSRFIELEEEIRSLESKIQMLQLDKSSHEGSLLEIVQQKRNVELDLKWKTDLRYELERKGLQFDDPLKLVEATRFFKDSGADEKCWKDFQTSRKWRMPSTVSTIK